MSEVKVEFVVPPIKEFFYHTRNISVEIGNARRDYIDTYKPITVVTEERLSNCDHSDRVLTYEETLECKGGCSQTCGGSRVLNYYNNGDLLSFVSYPPLYQMVFNCPEIYNYYLNGSICACCLNFKLGMEHYESRKNVKYEHGNNYGELILGRMVIDIKSDIKTLVEKSHIELYREQTMFDVSIGEFHSFEIVFFMYEFDDDDGIDIANPFTERKRVLICTECLHKLPLIGDRYYHLPHELIPITLYNDTSKLLFINPVYKIVYPIGG